MSSHQILNNVAQYSLQIGLLVGMVGFVPALFRMRLPSARLAYWHILLAVCLLLPLVGQWNQTVIDVGGAPEPPSAMATAAPAPAAPLPQPHPPRYSQSGILLALLALGALARLAWLCAGLRRLRQYRLNAIAASGAEDRFLSSAIGLTAVGLRELPELRLSGDISSPVTFGFFRPVVLLPATFPELNQPAREAILAHEFLHVRRRDWLVTLLEELVRAALWFHPAIWWLLGETQLAREQVVDRASVEITRNRDEYVDALLAIAGARPEPDLAPAPLFLRKRHLRHRVVTLLKEVGMSKKHCFSALAAGLSVLAAAAWLATATFPLAAAPQLVADAPGVTVDPGGAALMHRMPVIYPDAALKDHIEGTVLVQATVDSAGNVTDASVLSGPEELRKAAIQSVLQWHFVKGGSSTKTVSIVFQAPATSKLTVTAPALPATPPNGGAQTTPGAAQTGGTGTGSAAPAGQNPGTAERPQAQAAVPPAGSPAYQAITEQLQQLFQQMTQASSAGGDLATMAELRRRMEELSQQRLALMKIRSITVAGLPDEIRDQLLASLPVHVGDAPTAENMQKLNAAMKQFDEHLMVSQRPVSPGTGLAAGDEVDVQIRAPGQDVLLNTMGPASGPRISVGAQVQQANLVKKVLPVYPPLARSTGVQGHIILDVLIGTDGTVQELKLNSGHPLLAPAAMDAVKQWVYKPTMLNGEPVQVQTQVDVNFTLQP